MPDKQGKTSKQKLDELLGISSGEDIDGFLEKLTTETEDAKEAFDKIDDSVREEIKAIDTSIATLNGGNLSEHEKTLSIASIESSMKDISELIDVSKGIIKHVYNNIVCTELVDSELIHAAAAFIESCHLNVKEYIDLYKDRLKFLDKIQFEILQQKHRMELLDKKHEYEMEKLRGGAVDVPEGMVSFDTDKLLDELNKKDK